MTVKSSRYAPRVVPPEPARPISLRERTRAAVRDQVRHEALGLFLERGFDAVRTEDIAAAVGISPRSFFRYFDTKQDVLTSGSIGFGDHVRDAFTTRPTDEPLWSSLRTALQVLVDAMAENAQQSLDMMRVIMSTASLRAHHYEKHLAWEQLLLPEVAKRVGGAVPSRPFRAQVITHAAMACLDVALADWVAHDGQQALATLLDSSFDAIRDL